MKQNKEKILNTLKRLKDELNTTCKVKKIGLFGSFIKNEQKENSDIDLLVEFEDDADLFHFVGLSRYLEEVFKSKVDVISKLAIKEELKQQILEEVVYE